MNPVSGFVHIRPCRNTSQYFILAMSYYCNKVCNVLLGENQLLLQHPFVDRNSYEGCVSAMLCTVLNKLPYYFISAPPVIPLRKRW